MQYPETPSALGIGLQLGCSIGGMLYQRKSLVKRGWSPGPVSASLAGISGFSLYSAAILSKQRASLMFKSDGAFDVPNFNSVQPMESKLAWP